MTTEEKLAQQASQQTTAVSAVTTKRNEVRDMLDKYKGQIAQALPKFITPERLIRVALTAINRDPNLLQCTTASLVGSILQSAQLGLIPDGAVGEGYLLSFNNTKKQVKECQFMIGYRGYITLAYRSGMVESFQARAVYAADKFNYEFGLNEKLEHVPVMQGARGELTHVYAVVKLKGGGYVMDVMTRSEVDAIRMFSKSPNSPAWRDHYAEMAIKTMCRKIAKRCPLSPEFVNAATMDERVEVLNESQGNEYLVLNTNEDNTMTQQVEETIAEDITEANDKPVQEAIASATERGENATQQTLDMLNEIPSPTLKRERSNK